MDGADNLIDQEKSLLSELIEKGNKSRTTPLPEINTRREKYSMQAPTKIRRALLKSATMPSINVMFTNADQLTSTKKTELMKRIEREKPLIIAVCERQPKNSKEYEIQDYDIPDYTIHPVNLDLSS